MQLCRTSSRRGERAATAEPDRHARPDMPARVLRHHTNAQRRSQCHHIGHAQRQGERHHKAVSVDGQLGLSGPREHGVRQLHRLHPLRRQERGGAVAERHQRHRGHQQHHHLHVQPLAAGNLRRAAEAIHRQKARGNHMEAVQLGRRRGARRRPVQRGTQVHNRQP